MLSERGTKKELILVGTGAGGLNSNTTQRSYTPLSHAR